MSHTKSAAGSSHWSGERNCRGIPSPDGRSIYVPATSMNITWGNDDRFWTWAQLPEDLPREGSGSASARVAELIQVNWLEATGSVGLGNRLSASKAYEVVFHVKFKADAFGWGNSPVTLVVVGPGGRRERKSEMMESYKRRGVDVWHEIHGGDFTVPTGGAGNNNVEFQMLDVDNGWWKGGLVFAGVTIRPKNNK